ncbi:hypothetical protein [Pandoraea apista]|uniref:hypothetical protein n=1 Tax=Pandoraea apista TaxID=93218 RepID=UPI0006587C2B|nr:hypothetical protein [Pandoraea apista]ALS64752.1 hypothetical protein AT395_06940 [Pandoraea apista]RRW91397.1 hypothetical protein EGJ54_20855 [Pandoraea apista]RRX00884.1 hypothetical protein EGJ56_17515 [Pandoraea apista]CFB64932.1 hypothetical protein LMG16407_04590 [Pandoraea apista]
MKTKHDLKIYFSDFFGVTPTAVEDYGAFNISLLGDLPLFIDPFLLFNSENKDYQILHDEIIKYMLFLKKKSSGELPKELVKAWFYFPEVKQNWFGYSKTGNDGRGLGKEFAFSLKRNFISAFADFGNESRTGTHLGKLTLIKNGVGKDNISDFTCNLIKGFLAEYTENFAKNHIDPKYLSKFNIGKTSFNYKTESWATKEYTLPKFGNDFVLLTPVNILTKDDAWISHNGFVEDFSRVLSTVENAVLRKQMENYFISALPTQPTKTERESAIEKVVQQYPELLDLYVKIQEDSSSDATSTSADKVQAAYTIFVNQIKHLASLLDKTKFYETNTSSYTEGMKRIQFLKDVIEQQDGYRLFYIDGKPISRESDIQIMFKLTWFASSYSADAEVNNGRGPADFLVSYGSADKSIIEFKLAKNTQLEKNLKKQAEIYSQASKATHPPIKVILFFTQPELTKTTSILQKLKLDKCPEIVLIDGRGKISASKAT